MQVFKAAFMRGFTNWNNFSGRSSRSEYWYFLLSMYLVMFVAGLVLGDASAIVYLVYLVPLISCAIRRMHDTGRSGWWTLVPIVNLVFACTPSESSLNSYGPPSPPLA